MTTALVEPKFRVREMSEEIQAKLTLSLSECENQAFKEIRCGYCDFPVGIVSCSSNGYFWVKCKKCKAEYPINLAYFYRARGYKRPDPFIISINTTE